MKREVKNNSLLAKSIYLFTPLFYCSITILHKILLCLLLILLHLISTILPYYLSRYHQWWHSQATYGTRHQTSRSCRIPWREDCLPLKSFRKVKLRNITVNFLILYGLLLLLKLINISIGNESLHKIVYVNPTYFFFTLVLTNKLFIFKLPPFFSIDQIRYRWSPRWRWSYRP